MFRPQVKRTKTYAAANLATVIYHSTVRNVRKSHGNALIGLLLNMMQTVILVAAFFVMYKVLGLSRNAVRGDFLLYIMSGIFLFMTHTKALGAVAGSEGPASPMMKHAPMNTMVAISSAALASLYMQFLSVIVVLFIYDVAWKPVEIYEPLGAIAMFLLAWFSGVSIGMIFLAIKPWWPSFTGIATTIYSRANMIASGKMFLANSLPHGKLILFSWNTLFHCIDQARGFTFINYNPHYTSYMYALKLSVVLIMIGLMGEFYTRKNASASWQARQ